MLFICVHSITKWEVNKYNRYSKQCDDILIMFAFQNGYFFFFLHLLKT